MIKVDVRIIAATNRNLEELMLKGRFREDLYYRLNVVPIHMPALRERKEDILPLTEHFLNRFNNENKKGISLSSGAFKVLEGYRWPGNVRELENTIERLVVMSNGKTIEPSDLPVHLTVHSSRENLLKASLTSGIGEIEKSSILHALEETGWVQAKAAKMLGITPRQIGYKMKKYAITPSQNLSLKAFEQVELQ